MDLNSGALGARRNEDIALDLMKFVAGVTGAGKSNPTAGFSGGHDKKPEDYANQLLELYTRCLETVNGKK
ncbi:MAG: hypothetical protein ABI383_16550 [Acidobacteriaceae bacterium]